MSIIEKIEADKRATYDGKEAKYVFENYEIVKHHECDGVLYAD